tara:strand:- start:747 stop:1925 length:1179 start_codon:yes stop_codon:yes gene_type:complete
MIDKKLHVMIIPSWYPEYNGHYIGSFFREQALGIKKRGCEVGVVYPELKSLRNTFDIRILPKLISFNDEGIKTYMFKWSNWFIKSKSIQIYAFKKIGYLMFNRYIKNHGLPDVIHCQSIFNAGFLGEYIFDKHKIPYIITEHNSGFYYKDQGLEKHYSKALRVINKSQKCFAVSSNYAEYLNLELKSNKKWNTHHNIVDNRFLNSKINNPNKKKFIFLCVSRLHAIKNIDLIIKSFKIFNQQYSNSELRIVGVGSELKNLKNLAQKYRIIKNVLFLGQKLRSEIIDEYNSCSAFIYASNFETFGVIFVESMALGRPIISLSCGSSEEIIPEYAGIIVKKKTTEDMSNAMIKLHQDYSKYNPQKIREYCESKFSEEELSLKMIKEYKSVLINK